MDQEAPADALADLEDKRQEKHPSQGCFFYELYFASQSYIAYGSYIGFASYIAHSVRSCGEKQYALCIFGGFLDKHLLFRRRNARSSGDEEGSAVRNGRAYCYGKAVNRVAPDESTKLRVRCDFFCTNATSGIMRRRRLMCESRKERSDGIAIATKSIASSCPARRALPNGRWGKHVRTGDIFSRGIMLPTCLYNS